MSMSEPREGGQWYLDRYSGYKISPI